MIACLPVFGLFAGCHDVRPARGVAPKPITFSCAAPRDAYEGRVTEALVGAGFLVVPEGESSGLVEASRTAVYRGAGDGLQMQGPYRWESRYTDHTISITVQTVHVGPGRVVYPSANLDESAPPSDRQHFMPIVRALRDLCASHV